MILTEAALSAGVSEIDDLVHTARAGAALAEMIRGLAEAIGSETSDTVSRKSVVGSLHDLLRLAGFEP